MAYPMIALTSSGTTFACASVSLTETGLAVLNESGSRIGFVPYDSLEYVAPTEESRVSDPPMRILTEDGSRFGAASISQAAAGVAVLDQSGSRIGFVPYDTLTYVLPEAKTGPTLPADATPVDGVNIEEEDDGGSPVWEDDEGESDDSDADEGGESGEDADGEEDADGSDGNEESDEYEDADGGEEDGSEEDAGGEDAGGDEDAAEGDEEAADGEEYDDETAAGGEEESSGDEEATDEDDEPVWGDDPVEESDRDGSDDAADGEREEAEESELVVEWSFGDDE